MNKTKWYEESPGVTSSKRGFGGVALGAGVAMKLIIFVWALVAPLGDVVTASAQADGLLMAGGGILFGTVFDVFKRS